MIFDSWATNAEAPERSFIAEDVLFLTANYGCITEAEARWWVPTFYFEGDGYQLGKASLTKGSP